MNNFIVGQVTPTMMKKLGFGTFVFFGAFSFVGGLFILFLVPETKGLTLEEMDIVFGSEGTAQADFERMAEINEEIGLNRLLNTDVSGGAHRVSHEKADVKEKEPSL